MSLRKFADAGLGIYLDNERINIFDPESKKLFIAGIYEKPYWIIEFEVDNDLYKNETSAIDKNKTIAYITTRSETTRIKKNNREKFYENVEELNKIEHIENSENESELEVESNVISETLNFDTTINDRVIGDLNDIESVELLRDELKNSKVENQAMLWHMRMGHASIAYLKALQKFYPNNKELRTVNFKESVLECCEICQIAKFNKLPF